MAFARKSFGSSQSQMPGLCKFSKDCGAYNAYDHWDLGYGRGKLPSSNSLLVLSKQKDLPFGHIARVNSVSLDSYGNYHLMVDESNWYHDERVSCNVDYIYDPKNNTLQRSGSKARVSKGFIYSKLSEHPSNSTVYDDSILRNEDFHYKPLPANVSLSTTQKTRKPHLFASLSKGTQKMSTSISKHWNRAKIWSENQWIQTKSSMRKVHESGAKKAHEGSDWAEVKKTELKSWGQIKWK
ncbi:hypothetical protein MJH12_06515, partial [bacterium]|nr:hypothetical protein [bacterium]